jgi:signal transduction histidine kinase/CheY-like chemotaxis protein
MVSEALATAQNTASTANFETRLLKRDGSVLFIFVDYRPSLAQDGTLQGACATLVDVTERVGPLREALAVEQQRASVAEEHRRKYELFVDMICHEIRNPINGIHNNVDLLINGLKIRGEFLTSMPSNVNKSVLSDQIVVDKEAMDSIITCANQQRVVADDVLHLSALESGKVVLSDVAFDPRKIVERLVKTYRAEAISKQIQFVVNVPTDEVCVRGDPDRLQQIMFNLVTNAIKFTEKSDVKKVTVTLEIKPGTPPTDNITLCVTIEDTGLGMTTEEQAALFKRFSQANVQTYREYGGSGLGLFITKGLINLMNGDIKVSSTKHKGTKFYFTVQCKKASISDKPKHMDSPSPETIPRRALSPRASLQILIAEDDIVNQKVLKRHLEQGNHVVTIAGNGKLALDSMVHQRFDLIFMDVEMPVMGGLDATRAIRKEEERLGRPKIPIIGLSGNARKEYLSNALDAGMNSYIVKPYQKEDLFAKIHELVHPWVLFGNNVNGHSTTNDPHFQFH